MRPKSLTEYILSWKEFLEVSQTPASLGSARSPASIDLETRFNDLALGLFALQFAQVEPYRKLCLSRRLTPDNVEQWQDIPSVPVRAFKEFEMTSLPPEDRTAVFYSSGTTTIGLSRHFHNAASLAVYESSLRPWFQRHLLPDCSPSSRPSLDLLVLTPPPSQVPHSSLARMFETIRRTWFGFEEKTPFTGLLDAQGGWVLDFSLTRARLRGAVETGQPMLILGTAFSYVHLLDDLASLDLRFPLPPGSRLLETGGYKGRSRAVAKSELYASLSDRLGLPCSSIISEYGMSELSSQAYDLAFGEIAAAEPMDRTFHFPPWARALAISPETGRPAEPGGLGLLRIIDLANAYSVLSLQTEDLAVQDGAGFRFAGRAAMAEARGCSLLPSSAG